MSNSIGVRATHRDYDKAAKRWKVVRDAIAGECDSYLRNVGAIESDETYGRKRQAEYVDGAIYYNFTKRTLAGMVGSVMRKDPEIILPDALDYLLGNADGSGVGLIQHAQNTLYDLDSIGRGGLLVDAPNVQAATMAEQNAGLLNSTIAFYPAEAITNWRTERIGSINVVTMVVLREPYEYPSSANEFLTNVGEQYRVLDIVDNEYRQRIYRYGYDGEQIGDVVEVFPKLNGVPRGTIPFAFIGATNNDQDIDDAPLYPLAELNIGHYRNSADSEENTFVTGQVMLTVSPSDMMSPEQWREANPNGIKFGARCGINLGFGGRAELLQASPSTAARQGMLDKETQAVQIGAQLITPTMQITAESARLQRAADSSVMATVAKNVSMAYETALRWVAQSMNVADSEEIAFELNTEFFLMALTAQDRSAWMADINAGLMPATSYYAALRAAGVTNWTDEEIETALGEQGPRTPSSNVNGDIPASANDNSQDANQDSVQ